MVTLSRVAKQANEVMQHTPRHNVMETMRIAWPLVNQKLSPQEGTGSASSAAPAAAATAKAVAPQGVQQETWWPQHKRAPLRHYDFWTKPNYEAVPMHFGSDQHGVMFSAAVPSCVRDVGAYRNDITYDGTTVTDYRQRELNRVMNRALRHDDHLRVTPLGFTWIWDLQKVLRHPPYRIDATVAEVSFVVARERAGRFEIAAPTSDFNEQDVVIRCVQGHSGNNIVREISDAQAHRRFFGSQMRLQLSYTRPRPSCENTSSGSRALVLSQVAKAKDMIFG